MAAWSRQMSILKTTAGIFPALKLNEIAKPCGTTSRRPPDSPRTKVLLWRSISDENVVCPTPHWRSQARSSALCRIGDSVLVRRLLIIQEISDNYVLSEAPNGPFRHLGPRKNRWRIDARTAHPQGEIHYFSILVGDESLIATSYLRVLDAASLPNSRPTVEDKRCSS